MAKQNGEFGQQARGFPRDPTGVVVLGGVPPDEKYPVLDELGRDVTVAQLYNIVSRANTPSAVGLFGPWGSGKSTLLHCLAAKLRAEPIGQVIELDPWVYESEGSPLRALVWKVQAVASKEAPKLEKAVPWGPLRDLALAVTPTLGTAMAAAVGGPVAAAVAGSLALTADVLKQLQVWWAARGEVGKVHDLPAVEVFRLTMREVLRDLAATSAKDLNRPDGAGRVVILIDDLDRCLPESMLALLQATRLLFCGDPEMPVVFVFALDREQVVSALRHHYAALDSSHAERFMEKIFDISIWVPGWPESGLSPAKFIESRLGGPEVLVDLLREGWREILDLHLTVPALRSPRLLHRLASRLVVLSAVPSGRRTQEGVWNGGRLEQDALIVLIISCYNPGFRANILHRPDRWRAVYDAMMALYTGKLGQGVERTSDHVRDAVSDMALADILHAAGVCCPTAQSNRRNIYVESPAQARKVQDEQQQLTQYDSAMSRLRDISERLTSLGL